MLRFLYKQTLYFYAKLFYTYPTLAPPLDYSTPPLDYSAVNMSKCLLCRPGRVVLVVVPPIIMPRGAIIPCPTGKMVLRGALTPPPLNANVPPPPAFGPNL